MNGFPKELTGLIGEFSGYLYSYDKENYNKNEVVSLTSATLSEKDKAILIKKNLCSYLYYGKFSKEYNELKGYPNIRDKNVCFNTDQFSELENLIDCGYAEINFKIESKEYNIKTCFFIPGDDLPNEIYILVKRIYIDPLLINDMLHSIGNLIYYVEYLSDLNSKENLRQLSTFNYEIVVENKNGKKVKYSDKSPNIEIISSSNGKSYLYKLYSILLLLLNL